MTQYLAVYRANNGDLRRLRCESWGEAVKLRPVAHSHGTELLIFTRERRGPWRRTYYLQKSDWGAGPWLHEPDVLRWRDKATNLHCAIDRSTVSGSLCGYVAVSRHHPAWGRHYQELDVDVHGGLTFYGMSNDELSGSTAFPLAKDTTIENPLTGESFTFKAHRGALMPGRRSPLRWWYGFDTAHAWDYSPAMVALIASLGMDASFHLETGVYRDLAYVTAEIQSLARQLQAIPRKARKITVDASDEDSTPYHVP